MAREAISGTTPPQRACSSILGRHGLPAPAGHAPRQQPTFFTTCFDGQNRGHGLPGNPLLSGVTSLALRQVLPSTGNRCAPFFALLISALLIIGFAPMAHAISPGSPCASNPPFFRRRASAGRLPPRPRPGSRTTARLSVHRWAGPSDRRWAASGHARLFLIPGLLFLYIAARLAWPAALT